MTLPYATLPGDLDHLISDEHVVVNRLFEHLEAGRGDRRTLVDQVSYGRTLHAHAEEEVLYPALAEIGAADAEEGRDEHQALKRLLVLLDHADPGSHEFERALNKLIGGVRHHVDKEEREFLPALRRAVGAEEMGRLGERYLAAKRSVPARSHPTVPPTGRRRRLMHVAAGLMDKVRDRASGRSNVLSTDASCLLDTQAQRILDTWSRLVLAPYELLTLEQARQQPSLADAAMKILRQDRRPTDPEEVGSAADVTVPGPGGDLVVRVYKPLGQTRDPVPVVMWVHGGGWILFTNDDYDASCRALVNRTGTIVVSPEYRKAPEHVFPAAHEDVLATYRWLRTNATGLGGDPSRIAIGGEGVGANMAAATCGQLKQAGEPLPVAQVLVCPLTTTTQYGASMRDAADARPLNRPLLSWMMMHAFHGVTDSLKDPRVDLLPLSAQGLAGLPPTLIVTTDRDVLQSQGDEWCARLAAAGVRATSVRYQGVMHDFFGLAAVLDKAAQAQEEVALHLRQAFGEAPAAHAVDGAPMRGRKVIG
ncbi:alpha/beta hydrolase fold domain-containing protein [Micromonospora chalcea]|uniref:alpha/beta hydrolase fold domain-containing protein n=1 Tax=Micromonospora chalcea TaxID=1874 RepID=UPI0021A5B041|nr:alpha/beta hydrolase fold domain-containing protein [Micromonospora chalcea]MCT2282317.1 alpha/beta hydrolase fold domain-containing protein [Micromonospora chalcea]